MRPRHMLPVCLALIGVVAPTRAERGPPATAPVDLVARARFASEQRAAIDGLLAEAPRVAPRAAGDVVRFEIHNGRLVARLLVPDVPDDGVGVALPIADAGGNAVARVTPMTLDGDPPLRCFRLGYARFDEANARTLHIECYPLPGRFNCVVTVETPRSTTTIDLLEQASSFAGGDEDEQPPTARILLDRDSEADAEAPAAAAGRVAVTAGSFVGLVEARHDDVLAMLGEGLTTLRSMQVLAGVSEAEARAVLAADEAVDAGTRGQIDAVVATLRAEGSAAVPAQRARLRALGPAAMMAFARLPRAGWSADLALNADTVMSGLQPVSAKRAAALLASPTRLVDLLYADDEAIRRAAAERLAALGGRPTGIDPAADPYAIADRIETLRIRLTGD